MVGSRIKGITVEIGGDTTKLQTALKGVNTVKNYLNYSWITLRFTAARKLALYFIVVLF